MRSIFNINPVLRATGVIGVVAALVGGITYANLNSSATLTDSSVNSATASLKIWDGDSFETTAPGYTITGLVPGTGSTNPLYLQNAGGVPLGVTAHVPTLPGSTGFSGWENLTVKIHSEFCGPDVTTNMQALNVGEVALPCNPLAAGATANGGVPGTEGNYTVKFDIVPASITGSQAGVGNFNIVLTGTQP